MKRTAILLAAAILLAFPLHATTVDGRFVVVSNTGSAYSVKVQVKVDAAKDMGGATMQFTFNSSALSIPNSLSSGTHYTFHNFTGGNYGSSSVTKTTANGNTLSLNIELNVDNAGTTVNTSWTDVATINFTTTSSTGNSNLQWSLIEIYDEDNATQWDNGSWDNLNTSPLPVELIAFRGRYADGAVNLDWTTASELNNLGFVLERSADGFVWDSATFISGHASTDVRHEYAYRDVLKPDMRLLKELRYRLRQIDRDGSEATSAAINVALPAVALAAELHSPYPNPFTSVTTIRFTLAEPRSARLTVTDLSGRVIEQFTGYALMDRGSYEYRFSSEQLPAGIYHIVLETGDGLLTRKLVLTK